MGCRLKVRELGEGKLETSGNKCARGPRYAAEEFLDPRRTVAVTVALRAGDRPPVSAIGAPARIPVRTAAPFPKDRVPALIEALAAVELALPVRLGQVVIRDALGTGIDVIATRSLPFPSPGAG
jgi:CxxC motif-containing protein